MEVQLPPSNSGNYPTETEDIEIYSFHSQTNMFKNKYTIGIGAGILILIVGTMLFSVPSGKSPEELRMAAAMARIAAMKDSCKTIAQRVTECFESDDKVPCVQMQESYAWFMGTVDGGYGDSPDFACSTIPDPLAFGAPSK